MKTVLFLGAGATRAQFCWEDKIHPEKLAQDLRDMLGEQAQILKPPLDNDFVDLAMERCTNNFPCVQAYLERELGTDILQAHALQRVRIGMEWLFIAIFRQLNRDVTSGCSKRAWHNLLVTYRKLIGVSTNVLSLCEDSPLPKLFCHLKSSNLAIITLNQDLVAERVVADAFGLVRYPRESYLEISTSVAATISVSPVTPARQAPDERDMKQLYGNIDIETQEIGRDGTWREFCRKGWPKIDILKLHGSLNWWYASASEVDQTPLNDVLELRLTLDADVACQQPIKWKSDDTPYLYPFVVPPVEKKDLHFLSGHLEPIWDKARQILRECEKLVVFGYSLPPADQETKKLFEKCLGNVKEVTVIDVSCSPAGRLQKLIGKSVKVEPFKTVDEYLDCKQA